MNEKIKRKAHVKQSFSLDFLERGTFTEYPYVVRIPMANGVDSLNVAAASAIAFWQLRVQNDTDLPPSPDDVHI